MRLGAALGFCAAVGVVTMTLALRGGAAEPGPRVVWPEGSRYTYSVSWRVKNGKKESSIDGEIALERTTGTPERMQVALSWTRVDRFSNGLQGKAATADPQPVAGQTAILEIDDRGRIGRIAFSPGTNPSTQASLNALALELRYTLPEGDASEWEAVERDPLGEAQVHYRAGLREMARESIRYRQLDAVMGELDGKQELKGGAVIGLDSRGVPLSIEETAGAAYTRPGGAAPAVQSSWSFVMHRTSG